MGTDGASGYAQAANTDVDRIDAAGVGAEAVARAVRSVGAGDLDPGEYPVVLEPYAVATLLEYLSSVGSPRSPPRRVGRSWSWAAR